MSASTRCVFQPIDGLSLTGTLSQWLALTPPDIVKANLQISDEVIDHLSKTKPYVVGATEV